MLPVNKYSGARDRHSKLSEGVTFSSNNRFRKIVRGWMKKFFLRMVAQLVTVVFVMIILSPLAPLVTSSHTVSAHVMGECSGDCKTCGCSLESSSTRTCCCWQNKKKLQEEEKENSQNVPTCCNPNKGALKKIQKKMVSIKSNCSCKQNKLNAIFDNGESPLITCRFVEIDPDYTESRKTNHLQQRMTERHVEPPDPPPQFSIYS